MTNRLADLVAATSAAGITQAQLDRAGRRAYRDQPLGQRWQGAPAEILRGIAAYGFALASRRTHPDWFADATGSPITDPRPGWEGRPRQSRTGEVGSNGRDVWADLPPTPRAMWPTVTIQGGLTLACMCCGWPAEHEGRGALSGHLACDADAWLLGDPIEASVWEEATQWILDGHEVDPEWRTGAIPELIAVSSDPVGEEDRAGLRRAIEAMSRFVANSTGRNFVAVNAEIGAWRGVSRASETPEGLLDLVTSLPEWAREAYGCDLGQAPTLTEVRQAAAG